VSFTLQAMVWPANLDGTSKLVLLRLADFANDDGGSIFPTVKRVAEDCGISARTTQETLRRLESAGVLVMVREADAGARKPREYRIDVPTLASLSAPETPDEGCEICTGAKSALVQKTTMRGAKSAPKPTIEPTKDPAAASAPEAVKPKAEHVAVGERIAALTGWDQSPNWFGDYGRVIVWLKAGWSPELDILPTVERLMAGRNRKGQGPPRGLDYFETAIADAHASRTKPLPEGGPDVRQAQQRDPVRGTRPASGGRFAEILQRDLAGRA
jgi:hypothetical protein